MEKLYKEKLLDLISRGESETTEFKIKMPHESMVAKTIAAFANTSGGVIIFGIDDTGSIIGLSEADTYVYKQKLIRIANSLLPSPSIVDEIYIQGKKLVYISIDKAAKEFSPVLLSDGSIFKRKGSQITHNEVRRAKVTVPKKKILIFLAMSFRVESEPALEDYYQAILRAIKKISNDIELIRIDLHEGDYEISSEIMKKIDEVDVVIADFTLNPPNVYFEAGFCRGAKKRIIQIARKETQLEFDVRNWRTAFYRNATELEKKIKTEIESAIQKL